MATLCFGGVRTAEGMTPGDAAKKLEQAGADIVGGCCGCQGSHIRQMARALGKKPAGEREWEIDYERPQSATEAYHHMRQ